MKVIKPLGLGILHRTFEHGGRCRLVVTAVAFFSLDDPDVLLPEINLWKLMPAELGENGILDEWMLKTRGEVLVTGKAYPPGGDAQPVCAVRVCIGPIDKRLFVVGDRFWSGSKASEPIPFREMPVTWAQAFGGPGYKLNPLGKGYGQSRLDDGTTIQLLPNIEDPKQAVAAPADRPKPAGFDAYDLTWPQRFKKVGTYDSRWLEKDFPGLAADIDWTFFNRAPEDQWLEGNFQGDEAFRVENMHSERSTIESRLPAVVARCFVVRAGDERRELCEIPLRIDTVHLFPNSLRGVLLFRGTTDVAEDDAADISLIVAAAEARGQPKPLEHYRSAVAQRLDRDTGHLYALRDSDLMPPRAAGQKPVPAEAFSDMEELLQTEGLMAKRMRQRALSEHAHLRAVCRLNEIDPDEHLPKLVFPDAEPMPSLDELPAYVEAKTLEAEQARADAEQRREEAIAKAREQCAKVGVDLDAIMADAAAQGGGPPEFSAQKILDDLRAQLTLAQNAGTPLPAVEQRLADEALPRKLEHMEDQLKQVYRQFAHYMPAANSPQEDQAVYLRVKLQASLDAGESLADRDFTGADLSGMNLRGADLHDVFLEKADLSGADLSNSHLSGCVLARATLAGTDLSGADLSDANLGEANLSKANLRGANLTRAVLAKADLSGACFVEAELAQADLMEARCAGADFDGARGPELLFLKVDLSGVKLARAMLRKCVFVECTLVGTDFSGANLESAVLVTAQADGANFTRAQATNLRVVHGSSLAGAVFRGAVLTGANLRGTNLVEADFAEGQLDNADLSECDLRRSSFYRASAKQALFIRADLRDAELISANLMLSLLQKANIEGADFQGANLFRADFARIKGDRGTSFEDANMKQIRFVERSKHDQG